MSSTRRATTTKRSRNSSLESDDTDAIMPSPTTEDGTVTTSAKNWCLTVWCDKLTEDEFTKISQEVRTGLSLRPHLTENLISIGFG